MPIKSPPRVVSVRKVVFSVSTDIHGIVALAHKSECLESARPRSSDICLVLQASSMVRPNSTYHTYVGQR